MGCRAKMRMDDGETLLPFRHLSPSPLYSVHGWVPICHTLSGSLSLHFLNGCAQTFYLLITVLFRVPFFLLFCLTFIDIYRNEPKSSVLPESDKELFLPPAGTVIMGPHPSLVSKKCSRTNHFRRENANSVEHPRSEHADTMIGIGSVS